MAKKFFSDADKSYFGYGLAAIGYSLFEKYYDHRTDFYYFFIGVVLLGLGLARRPITAWTKGRLLEAEVVRLVIGTAMVGYGLFDWFRYGAVDPLFASIGIAVFGYGIGSIMQRKVKNREVAKALKHIAAPPPLSVADIISIRNKAEAGDGGSQRRLGYLYQSGRPGLPINLEEAYFWYRLAARSGYAGAEKSCLEVAASLSTEQINRADNRVKGWFPSKLA